MPRARATLSSFFAATIFLSCQTWGELCLLKNLSQSVRQEKIDIINSQFQHEILEFTLSSLSNVYCGLLLHAYMHGMSITKKLHIIQVEKSLEMKKM